ncbi:MAG: divalent-cation tolerance protein CutA [Bacteroidota bacterium]
MNARFIYITCGSKEEAVELSRELINRHLLACSNIMSPTTAIYRWKGKIEEAEEWALIGKTTADKVEALTQQVTELHSYDLPCIVSLSVDSVNQSFLQWIYNETHPSES